MDESDKTLESKKTLTVSRSTLILGGVVVVLLMCVAFLVGGLLRSDPIAAIGSADKVTPEVVAVEDEAEVALEPIEQPTQPEPPAESEPVIYELGETFTVGSATITVHSMEVTDSIPGTYGGPITPDPGGQLVFFKTTYSNNKYQVDLSCSGADLYIQVWDEQEREMAPVFENDRIAGNPGCNEWLLQDTPHEWNFVFQSVEGAKPYLMSFTETIDWTEPVWIALR